MTWSVTEHVIPTRVGGHDVFCVPFREYTRDVMAYCRPRALYTLGILVTTVK